jgi:hypothetical protein
MGYGNWQTDEPDNTSKNCCWWRLGNSGPGNNVGWEDARCTDNADFTVCEKEM